MRGHRYPRLCPRSQDLEGISFALPGMGPQSLLPMIRLAEFHPFGCHICPDVSETCCGAGEDLAGEDLAECPGVLQVPIQYDDGFIHNFWRLRPDSPGAVAFVATWRGSFSSVTWRLPSRRIKGTICCQILFSTRRIYLRLPLLMLLDMPPGMYPYLEDQSRPFTSPGTTRWWRFASSLASRGRTQSSSATSPPQSSQTLFLDAFYAPEELARSPEGVFRG